MSFRASFTHWLKSRSQVRTPIRKRPTACRPVLEALEDRVTPANRLDAMTDALITRLNQLDSGLSSLIAAANRADLPILNQPLGAVTEAGQAVGQFKSRVVDALRAIPDSSLTNDQAAATAIGDALYAELTRVPAGGVSVLGNTNGDGTIDRSDVLVSSVNLATGNLTVEFRLTALKEIAQQTFRFGVGLDGLPLDIESRGDLVVKAGFDYQNLKFGLTSGAFFFDTAAADELKVTVEAGLRNASMTGIMGFLEVTAAPNALGPNRLGAGMTVDVQPSGLVNPRLTGAADVNLTLTGSFNSSLKYQVPSIATDFQMHWDLAGPVPVNLSDRMGSEPTVNFNKVRVGLGQFLSRMLVPIVEDIQTAIRPLEPALAILNYRIPGLSDLSEPAGLGPVSLLTITKAAASTGTLPPEQKLLVEIATTIVRLLDIINDVKAVNGNVYVPIGGFSLNDSNATDLRALPSAFGQSQNLRQAISKLSSGQGLTAVASILQEQFVKFEQLLNDAVLTGDVPGPVRDKVRQLTDHIKTELDKANNGLKLEFPFIESPKAGVFNLLLGRDADFVTFTAKFRFTQAVTQRYDLFRLGPVVVEALARGDVDLDIYLKLGYDSYGIRQFFKSFDIGTLARGFYIDSSRDLIRFAGGASVGAAATLPLFGFVPPIGPTIFVGPSAEFTGGLRIEDFFVRLNDPNRDGDPARFHVAQEAGGRLFTTNGKVIGDVKVDIVVRTPLPVLDDVVLYSKTIASQTLIDLSQEQFMANPFLPPVDAPPQKVPVSTNLAFFQGGNDGVRNFLIARAEGGRYQLLFQNGLFGTMRVIEDRPLNKVESVAIIAAGDDDEIRIEGDLDLPIRVEGGGGKNSLILDDRVHVRNGTYLLKNSQRIQGSMDVRYADMASIRIDASHGNAGFTVANVPVGVTMTLNGSRVANLFGIGLGTNDLDLIRGNLVLNGGSGFDRLFLYDRGGMYRTTYAIDSTGLRRITDGFRMDAFGGFTFVDTLRFDLDQVEEVIIDGADRGARYEIEGVPTKIQIVGGTGKDVFAVVPDGQSQGLDLSIQDQGGEDTLVVNDSDSRGGGNQNFPDADHQYTVTDRVVRRDITERDFDHNGQVQTYSYTHEIGYAGIEFVQLYGLHRNARFFFQAFSPGTDVANLLVRPTLSVYTGRGPDVVDLGTPADGFGRINGGVALQDLGDADVLNLFNSTVVLDADGLQNFPATFAGYELINVLGTGGGDRVDVWGVAAGTAVTVNGKGGLDAVVVGRAGNLQAINGPVHVTNTNFDTFPPTTGSTLLTIDGSADTTPRAVTMTAGGVSGLAPADVTFIPARLRTLTVNGGTGGNAYRIADTPQNLPVILNTGTGADAVVVERTHSALTVNGQRGRDAVSVGANGVMGGITGPVTITNLGEWTALTLDDSADAAPRAVVLQANGLFHTVTGLSPAPVSVRSRDVSALDIRGGGSADVFFIFDTPASTIPGGAVTRLRTGGGDDIANILGTTGALVLDGQGGRNRISIGAPRYEAGSLSRIRGRVTLFGHGDEAVQPLNDVVILDDAHASPFAYTMTASQLTRFDAATGVTTAPIDYGSLAGLANLEIYAGNGGNTFRIEGTPDVPERPRMGLFISTGNGNDAATVLATGGSAVLHLANGPSQSVTIGDATHSLDAVRGTLTVGGGSDTLDGSTSVAVVLDDRASTEHRQANFDFDFFGGQFLERYDLAGEQNVPVNRFLFHVTNFDGIGKSLTYLTGRGGDHVFVSGVLHDSSITVVGHPGVLDVFGVGFGSNTDEIHGPVTVLGQAADGDFAYYYDYLNPYSQTYTVSNNPFLGTMLIERTGIAAVQFGGLWGVSLYEPAVGDNRLNVRSTPAGMQLGVVAGDGDRITLGSNAPNLGGTLDGILGHLFVGPGVVDGGATLIVDDSGNTSSARRVNISSFEHVGVTYGRIDGFTPGGITFQDRGEWTVDLRGGAGDDRFLMSGSRLATSMSIDGGDGNDVLIGSGGNVLRGGAGRDLLVAGAFASQLFGGGDDDILVGGTLRVFDPRDLDELMAVWTSAADYETRVANLHHGWLGADTVSSNGQSNTLFGEGGRDFFIGSIIDLDDSDDDNEVFAWI